MAPGPLPNFAPIAAIQTGINPDLNITLSSNVSIKNDHSSGFDIKNLPFSTKSILNAGALNIATLAGQSKLTVDYNGNVNAAGYITATGDITSEAALNSTSLFVRESSNSNESNFSVSSTGRVIAKDSLSIGSTFNVDASNGAVTSGAINSGSIGVTGTITTTSHININSSKIVLGNDGTINASGNFAIANNSSNKFTANATTGDVYAAGALTIDKSLTIATNKFTVDWNTGNTVIAGTTSAAGDLMINGDMFKVTASNGDVKLKGILNVNDKFSVSTTGEIAAAGNFAIATNKFKVDATNGNTIIAGTTSTAGDLIVNGDKFKVSAYSGKVDIKGSIDLNSVFKVSSSNGAAISEFKYEDYTLNPSSSNISATELNGEVVNFTSATNKHLTTQEYVDRELFKQTIRINTMLGSDETVNSFNNVLKVVTQIAGSGEAIDTLNGINSQYSNLLDKQVEVKTSLSKALEQAYNTELVACLPTVWADESIPLPIPNANISLMNEQVDGWFFENLVDTANNKTNKINWYLPVNKDMTVGDIKNMYLNAFIGSDRSLPIITIYTAPKPNNSNYAGWAGSRINYLFSNANPSANYNKTCCLYTSSSPMNVYDAVPTAVWKITTDNGTSNQSAPAEDSINLDRVSLDDRILYIAIQSASTAAKGHVKFIANSFSIALKTGTVQFTFSNSGPATNFLYMRSFGMHSDMSIVAQKNANYYKHYVNKYLTPSIIPVNKFADTNWDALAYQ